MWDNLIATLIAAAITGPIGYLLSNILSKDKYLPDASMPAPLQSYEFMAGVWYLYHFTRDAKLAEVPVLVTSKLTLRVGKNLLVTGSEVVQVEHRRSLEYRLRGQIRNGQFYFTCICVQDSSEIYSAVFVNLLDDDVVGIITAHDYDRHLFSSPALLSKSRKVSGQAIQTLNKSSVRFYTNGVEAPVTTDQS